MMGWEVSESIIDRVAPTPEAVLAHCGIVEPSEETLSALTHAIEQQTEYDYGLELLLSLALLSPEFAVI